VRRAAIGHWPLRVKLASAFLVLAVLALAQAAFAYRSIARSQAADAWVEHSYQVLITANAAQGRLGDVRIAYGSYLRDPSPQGLQGYSHARDAYSAQMHQLEQLSADNPAQVRSWKLIDDEVTTWVADVAQPTMQRTQESGPLSQSELASLNAAAQTGFDSLALVFGNASAAERQLLQQRLNDAGSAERELQWVLVGGISAIALAAIALAAVLSSNLGKPLARLAHLAERLAAGDLHERLNLRRQDEIGQTAKAVDAMADRLEALVGDLRQEVGQREDAESALQDANRKLTDWVGELEQRDREASLLADTGELLQACESQDEAYRVIAAVLPRLFPDEPLAVCVINDSRNLVEVVAESGSELGTQRLFQPDDCWALRLGRMHRSVQAGAGVFCAHLPDPKPPISLCLPMSAQGKSLGLLHLAFSGLALDSGRSFKATERLAGSLADQIGLALANLKLRETLKTQALRDPLTGLFNRRYLEESLDRELSRAERKQSQLSVLMLDIDHFKHLNDTYGHQTGDDMLRQLGRVLTREIRAGDLACRYGGEEFTLILPDASAENALRRAEHIRQAVADLPMDPERRTYGPMTVSLGVAGFPEHGTNAQELLAAADAALYRAKRGGRNRVVMAEASATPA